MKIIKSTSQDWQDKQGYSKKILFDQIDSRGIVVQDMKIKPGETAKSHHHKKQTEVFYFFDSNGVWIINGKEVRVNKGDVLIIEPFDHHEVNNNTSEDHLYIGFKYDYDPDDLYWD
jgi:mannose-6-phosphate isomerase-like protein (cupin superfamily)